MDRFHLIDVFVAVVDCQGLAGAGRKLGLSPPAVTRAINELEAHLGVRLLTRTTRAVRVTEAGARYAEDCRSILAHLREADDSAGGLHDAPRGLLTVSAPVVFGAWHVTPIVTEFLDRHAEVNVSCWFMDRNVNLLEEGVDVAVRIGHLPDSSMRAIGVGSMRLPCCASPGYLARHGVPQTPEDLASHVVIAAAGPTSATEWRVLDRGLPRTIKLHPRLTCTTSETAISAALAGFGITKVLYYKIAADQREGRLTTILQDFETEPLPVTVLHREGRHASRKARAFIDLAVERLRATLESIHG